MQFDVITLFPEMFRALTDWGITSRAAKQQRYALRTWNPRDFTVDNYRTIDDRPYGGGPGMVMLAKPLDDAIDAAAAAQAEAGVAVPHVVLMSPQGAPLTHEKVMSLSQRPGLVLLCGRYEAIDQRLIERRVDEEISLGDFVLSGGELPAMALIDAVVRHLPGVLGDAQSAAQDSFVNGLLDLLDDVHRFFSITIMPALYAPGLVPGPGRGWGFHLAGANSRPAFAVHSDRNFSSALDNNP